MALQAMTKGVRAHLGAQRTVGEGVANQVFDDVLNLRWVDPQVEGDVPILYFIIDPLLEFRKRPVVGRGFCLDCLAELREVAGQGRKCSAGFNDRLQNVVDKIAQDTRPGQFGVFLQSTDGWDVNHVAKLSLSRVFPALERILRQAAVFVGNKTTFAFSEGHSHLRTRKRFWPIR